MSDHFQILFIYRLTINELESVHGPEAVARRCSVRKGVLRNFAKLTGKHLCQSLYFNKVAGLDYNFIKIETLAQVFSCEFCKIPKNTFFTEHVWATASHERYSNIFFAGF